MYTDVEKADIFISGYDEIETENFETVYSSNSGSDPVTKTPKVSCKCLTWGMNTKEEL